MSSDTPGVRPLNGKLTDHVSVGVLTRIVPRSVVDEVLAETGRVQKRTRSLPAHVVVYFVLALALFTDGYEEVVRKLVHGLRFARVWSRDWAVPTTGALSQARHRLGAEPMQALFDRVAVPLARAGTPGAWLRGWRLMAIDGVMIDLPDTEANLADYGKPEGGTRRPFPQLRAVGLSECGTHALVAAELGTIYQGERELAGPLRDRVTPEMLLIADRGFHSYELWREYLATGAALLWRAWSTITLEPTTVLDDGSYLAEISNKASRSSATRIPLASVPNSPHLASHITVRIIEYQIEGHTDSEGKSETFRLITSILDPEQANAVELANAYHQRWEIESSFRELEIQLLGGCGLRSKTPELVRQEMWGLLISHYAVRAFMAEAADTVDLDPDRLSFTRTLNIVRRQVADPPAFSPHRSTPEP
ncbi:IS4 family transposase [Pseudonocardia nantongensis]|uniref:IS4 family transposase n=1 Tax=Pseudonocardia nantongensis TaxID=1181885 RepID=UPI00397D6442